MAVITRPSGPNKRMTFLMGTRRQEALWREVDGQEGRLRGAVKAIRTSALVADAAVLLCGGALALATTGWAELVGLCALGSGLLHGGVNLAALRSETEVLGRIADKMKRQESVGPVELAKKRLAVRGANPDFLAAHPVLRTAFDAAVLAGGVITLHAEGGVVKKAAAVFMTLFGGMGAVKSIVEAVKRVRKGPAPAAAIDMSEIAEPPYGHGYLPGAGSFPAHVPAVSLALGRALEHAATFRKTPSTAAAPAKGAALKPR